MSFIQGHPDGNKCETDVLARARASREEFYFVNYIVFVETFYLICNCICQRSIALMDLCFAVLTSFFKSNSLNASKNKGLQTMHYCMMFLEGIYTPCSLTAAFISIRIKILNSILQYE